MLARAVLAFIALPGVVAFLLPLLWVGVLAPSVPLHVAGLVPWLAGLWLLLWCVRVFYVTGKGTLAPWQPPTVLVVIGPYRIVRNPMYVGVLLLLAGWASLFASPPLMAYALCVGLAFHLRVVLAEEPALAATFGDAWAHYAQVVPRWLPSWSRLRDDDG